MNKKIISIILFAVILFADMSNINPQKVLANDDDYSINYNQEKIADVYVDSIQQSISSQNALATSTASKSGTWIKSDNGKWWYKHSDGSYTKNDWEYIDGYWYHFDSSGYMQISWQQFSGKWYHFDANGHMDTGWKYIGDYWYYFGSDGAMRLSWHEIDGKYYHFDAKGHMDTGWKYLGDYWYYFGSDGAMRLSWHKIDGKYYHFDAKGHMDIGWHKIADYWYYFNSSGEMQISWQNISGNYYHFDAKGHMDIGWHYIGNGWYYFESDGKMRTETLRQDQRLYNFDSSGVLIATEILVEREEQEKKYWCWAASSVMVGTYYTNSKKSQSEVVWYVKGLPINDGGTGTNQIRGIEFASGFKKVAKEVDLFSSFDSAINEIDNNKPFIMRMNWFGGGAHSVVCVGYKNTNTQKSIRVTDPAPNCPTKYYNYNDFARGVNLNSGKGWCDTIITYEYK